MGHAAFTVVLALAIGMLLQSVSRHLRIPGIVLLLLAGASLGPDGLGWIDPRSLGTGLSSIVELAVSIILFEGGLNLEIRRLRREQAAIRRLVTIGALVTLAGGSLAAVWILDWPWVQAMLFGSLVVVTGPTVIGPLVRTLRLRPKLATVLEAEGVLIDPIGAILAVLLLEIALAPEPGASSFRHEATVLLLRLGFGTVAGGLAGLALAGALRARRLIPEGHENIFALASVLLLFQGCEEVRSHSGIVAVTVAGVVVGNLKTRVDRDLREFKDQLTVLLIGMLFVLLAADVRFDDVRALGLRGLAVLAALVLVVRPLNVWASTIGSELLPRDRAFLAWIAPRGIVAAAVASVTAGALEARDLDGGPELRALVFLTIAGTVLLAGFTAAPVASLLRVRLPGRDGVAILGANGLGLALARELRDGGVPVVFLDANPQNCRRVEEAGFTVVWGDALQERTLARARLEGVGRVVGVTSNQMLNGVFVTRVRERFDVPEGYVGVVRPDVGLAPEIASHGDVHLLFEGPHDMERWDVRDRHEEMDVEHWVWRGADEKRAEAADPEPPPKIGERLAIFAVRRGDRVFPMHQGLGLKRGDVGAVAIHCVEREEAHRLLLALGWEPPEQKTEPSDEEAAVDVAG